MQCVENQRDVPTTADRRLIPLTEWPKYHPWPTIIALRHLVYNAETNGFHVVIKRVGRRILIDEQAFFEWVEYQSEEECRRLRLKRQR
jgi:hypothetical protein